MKGIDPELMCHRLNIDPRVPTRRQKGRNLLVYYVNKRLLDAELRYPELERLALALIVSTRKLRHYFLAHTVVVFSNHSMK